VEGGAFFESVIGVSSKQSVRLKLMLRPVSAISDSIHGFLVS
jgi:hypothetical protein